MDFNSSFFPDFTNFDNVVLAASIFLFYAGMEMGGDVYKRQAINPLGIKNKSAQARN